MKSIIKYEILKNDKLAKDIYRMVLKGDTSWIEHPGQFVNVTIEHAYLKRPISICDWSDETLTLIYKVVGFGTLQMSQKQPHEMLECLVGLGNGYDVASINEPVLVVGGGVGIPPLYGLTKQLLQKGLKVDVILGYNTKEDMFYVEEFEQLGATVHVCTVDGCVGTQGFVSDVMKEKQLTDRFYCTCGPLPMLKAVYDTSSAQGLLSFEERMGCGFGACMGCSCKTITGYKRICKEGPVMKSEDILWNKD